jgi:hypothetical protein
MNKLLDRPRRLRCIRWALLSCALVLCSPARAGWSYSVSWWVDPPDSTSSTDFPDNATVFAAVGAALGLWTRHLAGGAAVEVQLELRTDVLRAAGGSVTSGFVRHEQNYTLYEQGLAYEIRTGIDPNGLEPDVRIQLNPDYLAHELWFDSESVLRSNLADSKQIDAVSVFAHELGHALGFNGWWDEPSGKLPGSYGSTWDQYTRYDGSALFFVGPEAMALYGAAVPITLGNNWHVGNAFGPGADLLSDLMNGVAFHHGMRYDVSPLNLAMLDDMGVPLATAPEPQTWALMLMGLAVLAASTSRKRRERARCSRAVRAVSIVS